MKKTVIKDLKAKQINSKQWHTITRGSQVNDTEKHTGKKKNIKKVQYPIAIDNIAQRERVTSVYLTVLVRSLWYP